MCTTPFAVYFSLDEDTNDLTVKMEKGKESYSWKRFKWSVEGLFTRDALFISLSLSCLSRASAFAVCKMGYGNCH